MARLGTIPANGNAVLNLDFMPERLLIVDAVTGVQAAASCSQISVVNSGRQVATITGTRIPAFARLGKQIAGAAQILAETIQLGAGRVTGSTQITIANSTANALNVFGVSSGFSNLIANYVESSINANANGSYENFAALLLSTPANVDRVNLTFSNGFNDDFNVDELRALLGEFQNTNANGQLEGNLVVPNFIWGDNPIVTAVVFVNSNGNCVVGMQRFVESK